MLGWIVLGIVELLLVGLMLRGISNSTRGGEESLSGMMQFFGGMILIILFNAFAVVPWLLHR